MTERLSDKDVAHLTTAKTLGRASRPIYVRSLAREVQASRKLVADLLALHDDSAGWCLHCQQGWPCSTVRLIEASA